MKRLYKILLLVILTTITINVAYGLDLTTQTNRIFLNPFYRSSMTANTNYSYTFDFKPEDGITKVTSAIINLQVYINPSVTFNIYVNDYPCSTSSYTVSTTYASAGQAMITFDCTNTINRSATYTVKIKPTSANTGASTIWADVTYLNNQSDYVSNVGSVKNVTNVDTVDKVSSVDSVTSVDRINQPKMKVFGTEYNNQQEVKLWLQLLDGNDTYVNDGVCYVDIYTPDNEEYLEQALMSNMEHDGVYYYDMPAPMIEGVYPAIARCYYEALSVQYFAMSFKVTTGNVEQIVSKDDFECNAYSCGTGWNADWTAIAHADHCRVTTTGNPQGTYQLEGYKDCAIQRLYDNSIYVGGTSTVTFWAKANSIEAGETCTYQYYNGASYTTLLTLTGPIVTGTATKYTYDVSAYGTSAGAGIKLTASGGANDDTCFLDNITTTGLIATPNITKTHLLDSQYAIFQEDYVSGKSRLDVTLNVSNISTCALVDPNLLTSISVFVNGKFDSVANDDITISLYNFTSGDWVALPNKLTEGSTFVGVSNSYDVSNITIVGFYKAGNGILIKFNDSSFSDTTNNLFYIDQVKVECNQLSSPTWQEVKGSSEIHISGSDDMPFEAFTLCGNAETSCAEFRYDTDIINEPQGYIFDNITFINSYQTYVDEHFEYQTTNGVDCTAILSITRTEGTETLDITGTTQLEAGNLGDNCKIHIPVQFGEGVGEVSEIDREFNVVIITDNYAKWEAEWMEDYVYSYSEIITDYCDSLAEFYNLTYIIPLNQSLDDYNSNPNFLNCYRAMDDVYYFYDNYNGSLLVDTVGDYSSYLVGMRFYYPELKDFSARFLVDIGLTFIGGNVFKEGDLGKIALRLVQGTLAISAPEDGAVCNLTILYPNSTKFLDGVMTGLSGGTGVYYYAFTVPNLLGEYIYYADCVKGPRRFYSLDTFYVSSLLTAINNSAVWDNPDRNLTYYPPATVVINTTAISQAVWDYTAGRNLTYYPPATVVNTTQIAQAVWNYDGTIIANILTQIASVIWEYMGARAEII